MTALLVALLLQSSLLLPPRSAMENPAAVTQVPPAITRDYAALWARFVAGGGDAKLEKDLDNFSRKQTTFDPPLVIAGYIRLYLRDYMGARQKFTQAVAINPKSRIALYYLAEIAYLNQEYSRAADFYGKLVALGSPYPDIEIKQERAVLRATDEVLQSGARAEAENRLADAEQAYRQALTMLPKEPFLHQHLADLLVRENKAAEAEAERKAAEDLVPRRAGSLSPAPDSTNVTDADTLDELGRWGNDIDRFHEIRNAGSVTREQLAVLLVRYFPQIVEMRQTPQIVTDTQTSVANAEIQMVVGVGLIDPLPNHTFEPSSAVTRGDLGLALARLVRLLGLSPAVPQPNATSDLDPNSALYPEAQLVLGLGLMTLQDSGSFNVSGEVSGKEAVRSAERLFRIFQQAPH